MVQNGYVVRKFASIDDYLAQEKVATIWYFTRLQLERMGDKVKDKQMDLRWSVSMRRDLVDKLPPNTKFFHPLPRDSRFPTLPFFLDNTQFNGWDQQSQNGYFTRIVLLGMLGGHFGADFKLGDRLDDGMQQKSPMLSAFSPECVARNDTIAAPLDLDLGYKPSALLTSSDFIVEKHLSPSNKVKDKGSSEVGLMPISNGIVIENLAAGQSIEQVWNLMYMVRSILDLHHVGGQGVRLSEEFPGKGSGFIAVPDIDINDWDRQPLKRLAAMAPGSTLRVVKEGLVDREFSLQVPPRVYNFKDITCKNTACVSHPQNLQHEVFAFFMRSRGSESDGPDKVAFACKYCETQHSFWEIWSYKGYNPQEFTPYRSI